MTSLGAETSKRKLDYFWVTSCAGFDKKFRTDCFMLVYIYIYNTSKIETTREYLFFGFIFLSSSFFFTELNMFSLSFNPS